MQRKNKSKFEHVVQTVHGNKVHKNIMAENGSSNNDKSVQAATTTLLFFLADAFLTILLLASRITPLPPPLDSLTWPSSVKADSQGKVAATAMPKKNARMEENRTILAILLGCPKVRCRLKGRGRLCMKASARRKREKKERVRAS
jgi:hypothetical protein